MKFFRYQEDRLPVLFLGLLFALDVTVFAFVNSVPFLVAWTLLGVFPKGCFCAFNHHHQHVATFESPMLNRVLEQVYALETGVFSNGWVLHHALGHHMHYLDQKKDESGWVDGNGRTMGAFRYTVWNAVLAYPRAWRVGRKHKKHRPALVGSALFILTLLAVLLVWRPLPTLFVFVLPMTISFFGTVYATHAHHAGNSTASHFVACNNTLHRGYNVLTGNLGYHTAHHYKPGLHWSKLPALHHEIAARVPENCYLDAGLPYKLAEHLVWARPEVALGGGGEPGLG